MGGRCDTALRGILVGFSRSLRLQALWTAPRYTPVMWHFCRRLTNFAMEQNGSCRNLTKFVIEKNAMCVGEFAKE